MKGLGASPRDLAVDYLLVALEESLAAGFVVMTITDGDRDPKCPCFLPENLLNRLIGVEVRPSLQKRADSGGKKIVSRASLQILEILPDFVANCLSWMLCCLLLADDHGSDRLRLLIDVNMKSVESLIRMLHMRRRAQGGSILKMRGNPRDYLEQPAISVEWIEACRHREKLACAHEFVLS